MTRDHRNKSVEYWDTIYRDRNCEHASIVTDDWLERFDDIIMATQKPILDLGCGGGNDTLYLTLKGRKVIACDQSEPAINSIKKNFPEVYETRCFNMLDGLPFDDRTFDVIIADLCLHYFTGADTKTILDEILRTLTTGGHLLFRVNSINDTNYGAGQGKEIEHHLFETGGGTLKRFFDEDDIRLFFNRFEIEYLEEETMSRYGPEKRLFSVCAKKR